MASTWGLATPNAPGTNGAIQAASTATVSQITGVQVLNSQTTANPAGTWYWLVARDDAGLGNPSSLNSGNSAFDYTSNFTGQIVRSVGHIQVPVNPPPQPTDIYGGGSFAISPVHDNTNFNIYAQACNSGFFNDGSGNCSSWVTAFEYAD